MALSKLFSLPAEDRELLAQFSDAAICSALLPGAGQNNVGTGTVHTSHFLQKLLVYVVRYSWLAKPWYPGKPRNISL